MLIQHVIRFLRNILLLYALYILCAVAFLFENWSLYTPSWTFAEVWMLFKGTLLFATSAICYTNALFFVLYLLPLCRTSHIYDKVCHWLFVVVNGLCLCSNLVDAVYSRYSGRRTTSSFFQEFAGDGNLGSILGVELLHHWYLVLLGLALIAALWFGYARRIRQHECSNIEKASSKSSIIKILLWLPLVMVLPLCVVGMRGGATYHRPLSLSDANRFVTRPQEANIIINTPFSMIRTIGKATFSTPDYYAPSELDAIYSPVHQPSQEGTVGSPNVVVLILESFGSEYVGAGYTPFLDSLASESLFFCNGFANGRKSIDALPSVLSSIPMFVEPYVLTRYANNNVSSLAGELAAVGYRTAFFHGADNGSMGFQAFARGVGFQDYYGMDEYCRDTRLGGTTDFDGYWAIWDEEFLQYFALTLDTLTQPFLSTLFTATSHHPFNIPSRYQERFKGGSQPLMRTIQYSDYALRRFFATARTMPWFQNTIFVITADHTNSQTLPQYQTTLGLFRVPIIIYDPSHTLAPQQSSVVAQQIDLMPTLLNYLGYPRPYVAFGKDLLAATPSDSWAVNYQGGIYQLVRDSTLVQFDGQKVVGCFNYVADPCLTHNDVAAADTLDVRFLKAIIQSYMTRMTSNKLTIDN